MRKKPVFTWHTVIRVAFLVLFVILMVQGKFQLWLALYIGGVLASLVFGRIYCGYLCPMHTVMRPVEYLSRKMGIQQKQVPSWLRSPKTPLAVLALSLGSMLLAKRVAGVQLPILPILFVLSIAVTIVFPSEAWHKGLCPYSLLLGLAARFARHSHVVDSDSCARTRLCMGTCPAGAITMDGPERKARIDKRFCLQCELCAAVCPKRAISYTKTKK